MKSYLLTNRSSAHCFGVYEGATPEDAIEAMYRDAGYASAEEAAAVLSTTAETLRADLIVVEAES